MGVQVPSAGEQTSDDGPWPGPWDGPWVGP
jgi:hypothetical protein